MGTEGGAGDEERKGGHSPPGSVWGSRGRLGGAPPRRQPVCSGLTQSWHDPPSAPSVEVWIEYARRFDRNAPEPGRTRALEVNVGTLHPLPGWQVPAKWLAHALSLSVPPCLLSPPSLWHIEPLTEEPDADGQTTQERGPMALLSPRNVRDAETPTEGRANQKRG